MRRITAFVLSVAVLAGMTFTTLAAPTENIAAGGEQEETVLPAQPDMAGLELDVEEKMKRLTCRQERLQSVRQMVPAWEKR